MGSDSKVLHVAFYDMHDSKLKFSHAYPRNSCPLPDNFLRPWVISIECPSLVRVTVCDENGEHRYWEGVSGDTFHEKSALAIDSPVSSRFQHRLTDTEQT